MYWYGSHSFLNEYIQKNKCKRIMEIGVLNGENAVTMVKKAIQNFPSENVEYYGFDYFPDYRFKVISKKLGETGCKFKFFKGDTFNTLPKVVDTLPKMDLIFIDGSKSFSIAKSDWENSKKLMHEKTGVFVHNYEYSGVRQMVDNISREQYLVEIIHPQLDSDTAFIKKKELKGCW
jgi:predicted O-methyltransferase YrrM